MYSPVYESNVSDETHFARMQLETMRRRDDGMTTDLSVAQLTFFSGSDGVNLAGFGEEEGEGDSGGRRDDLLREEISTDASEGADVL